MTTTPKRKQAGPRSGPARMRVTGAVWVFGILYGQEKRLSDWGPRIITIGVWGLIASITRRATRRCGGGAAVVALACVGGSDRACVGSNRPTDRPTDRTGGGHGRATGGPADRRTGRTRATSEGVALAGLACGPGAGRDPRPFLKPHVEKERGSVPAPTIYMYHGALNMQGPAARILSSSLVNIHAENRASCSCML